MPTILSESEYVTVTRRGYPVATLLSYENYLGMREKLERMSQEIASMQETIEILQDTELMAAIREGMSALQRGDTISLEEARRALEME